MRFISPFRNVSNVVVQSLADGVGMALLETVIRIPFRRRAGNGKDVKQFKHNYYCGRITLANKILCVITRKLLNCVILSKQMFFIE